MEESYKGKFLIANSSIITDYFHNSVIFMVEHDRVGALGLVINKPMPQKINELIKGVPDKDIKMFSGGPVDGSFISILHDNPEISDPGTEIIPGVFMGRSFELLLNLMGSGARYRVFQGYSGWGSEQLEEEMTRKSWATVDGSAELIFQENPDSVWRDSLKKKGGIYKYYAEHTKDPMLN